MFNVKMMRFMQRYGSLVQTHANLQSIRNGSYLLLNFIYTIIQSSILDIRLRSSYHPSKTHYTLSRVSQTYRSAPNHTCPTTKVKWNYLFPSRLCYYFFFFFFRCPMPCATFLRRNPQTTSLMVCKHPPHAHSNRRAYFRSNESEITLSTHKHTQRRTSNHNAGSIALQIFTKRRSSTSGTTRQSECPRCQGVCRPHRWTVSVLLHLFFPRIFKAKRKTSTTDAAWDA